MGYYSCYKEKGNKWFFSSRRGGDAQRQGVRWLVKEWNGGQGNYMNPAATTYEQELSEHDAGLRLIAFVEGLDVLETGVGGGCDSRRINEWLAISVLPPLHFFNMGGDIRFVGGKASATRHGIFGSHGIVPTVKSDLALIKRKPQQCHPSSN